MNAAFGGFGFFAFYEKWPSARWLSSIPEVFLFVFNAKRESCSELKASETLGCQALEGGVGTPWKLHAAVALRKTGPLSSAKNGEKCSTLLCYITAGPLVTKGMNSTKLLLLQMSQKMGLPSCCTSGKGKGLPSCYFLGSFLMIRKEQLQQELCRIEM